MKTRTIIIIVACVLAIAVLACGSTSSGIEVRESSGGNENSTNGVDINQSAPEPTATKKPGTARSNPAPVGSEVVADDMAFSISGSVRPADDIVSAGK